MSGFTGNHVNNTNFRVITPEDDLHYEVCEDHDPKTDRDDALFIGLETSGGYLMTGSLAEIAQHLQLALRHVYQAMGYGSDVVESARLAFLDTLRAARQRAGQSDVLAEFRDVVASAEQLQAEAARLCDEANESGTENDEFAVRDLAADRRAEALHLVIEILGNAERGVDHAGW